MNVESADEVTGGRCSSMSEDPFMPAARRFPRDAWPPVASDESPSAVRPFVLCGARQVPSLPAARHRTAPHQTPRTEQTTSDGGGRPVTKPDTYYVPDD